MKTPSLEKRQQFVKQLLDDPNLAFIEGLRVVYHYTMFEYYMILQGAARRAKMRHGKFLYETTEVLNLRSEMQDL